MDEALAEFAPWIEEVSDFRADEFVQDLTDDVMVWVDGAAEMGPRALGHRSMLGDPRSEKVKDLLNEYKLRQWWRPVAPIVMAEYVGDWFEQTRLSPYMLEAGRVRDEVRDMVPAILHLDGTARHQTLTERENPLLHRAIEAFRAATGVPIVCNTSLNDKGEPIVDTAAEALTFCVRKGIRVAYVARTARPAARRAAARDIGIRQAASSGGGVLRGAGGHAGRDLAVLAGPRIHRGRPAPPHRYAAAAGRPEDLHPEPVRLLAERIAGKDPGFEKGLADFRRDHGPGTTFAPGPGLIR